MTDDVMMDNVERLAAAVVGRRIVKAEQREINSGGWWSGSLPLVLTLDDETEVRLWGSSDCCAYTELKAFLLNPAAVDHVITGVTAEKDFTRWHIFADLGDVLNLTVGWSEGSGWYGYGFDIDVVDIKEATLKGIAELRGPADG